jgi:predicted CXXCH cytochrome family protein
LRRWKWWLAWIAPGGAAVWLLWAAVCGDHRIYEAGPVSPAHAMFANDCKTCHTKSWQPAARLASRDPKRRSVPDDACMHCHDGPIHHEQQVPADVNCASCHREHRGKVELARVTDATCVSCHADLKTATGAPHFDPHVNSFFTGHPEFSVWKPGKTDTAVIKLNHAVHLKVEHLTCSSCHQPDAERRYMQPIDHEKHCSRCHSNALTFDSERFADQPAPHREPETVRAVMRQRYAEFIRKHPETVADGTRPTQERRVPGRATEGLVTKAEWDWVNQQVDEAYRVVFKGAGGCRYCHTVESSESGWQVAKPNIPKRWLPHSRFHHDSHRMLDCTECHAAMTSAETSEILLPHIESCRKCHGPNGGARSDCVECHRYHAESRQDFKSRWTIDRASESIRPQ